MSPTPLEGVRGAVGREGKLLPPSTEYQKLEFPRRGDAVQEDGSAGSFHRIRCTRQSRIGDKRHRGTEVVKQQEGESGKGFRPSRARDASCPTCGPSPKGRQSCSEDVTRENDTTRLLKTGVTEHRLPLLRHQGSSVRSSVHPWHLPSTGPGLGQGDLAPSQRKYCLGYYSVLFNDGGGEYPARKSVLFRSVIIFGKDSSSV